MPHVRKEVKGAREARPARSAGFLCAPQAIFLASERPILMILLHFLRRRSLTQVQRALHFVREHGDPAKMTYTRFDFLKRDPSSMQP